MDCIRKLMACVLVIALLLLVQGAAAAEGEAAGTGREFFRDDSPALGIDHSRPNSYLVYDLQKKLVAAKAGSIGLSSTEIEGMVSKINPPSGWKPAVASKGTQKILVFLVDFPDYPHGSGQGVSDVDSKMNGPGDAANYPTDNLHDFYARSSYNQLDFDVSVYGWYRADDWRVTYNGSIENRYKLFKEVLDEYNSEINYADFDNDKDGDIDNIWIIWTGPNRGWNSWWWAQYWYFPSTVTQEKWDGVYPVDYVWEWYTDPWSTTGLFDSRTPCHEMGHVLGLPDYYDYDGNVGPDGGVGGFDMMDGGGVDHNSFSKYLLGWTEPTVIGENPRHASGGLYPTGYSQYQTSAIIMPGATSSSWGEFFLAENRAPGYGNDPAVDSWTKKGLTIWHVDATVDPATQNFKYDNSWTDHKLLRLMEADGEEDIENDRGWDQDDIYGQDEFFGAATTPDSRNYAGSDTLVNIHDISEYGGNVNAHYAIGNYPPAITSIYPDSGTQNTILTISDVECSDYWYHPKTDFYIQYLVDAYPFGYWKKVHATDVTFQDIGQLSCTFDLTGVPPGVYTVYMKNPDGQHTSLADALTVLPPSITVTSPNGGEIWYTGTTNAITWEQEGLAGTNVRIDLWKDWPVGTRVRQIAASVPAGAGTYSWSIPSDIPQSANYWVNISSLSYPEVMDDTDGWLTVLPPASITLISPDGGEYWRTGTAHDITWDQVRLDGTNVRIDLYSGWPIMNHEMIVSESVPAGQEFYHWTVPADLSPSSLYWIFISSLSDPEVMDLSADPLTIRPPGEIQASVDPFIFFNGAVVNIHGMNTDNQTTYLYLVDRMGVNCDAEGCPLTDLTKKAAYGQFTVVQNADDNTFSYDWDTSAVTGSLVPGEYAIVIASDPVPFSGLAGHTHLKFGILVEKPLVTLPGCVNPPTDPDGDGIYEDLNGNGRLDFSDIVLYFNQMQWISENEPIAAFDLNGNGRIDFADIVALFGEI